MVSFSHACWSSFPSLIEFNRPGLIFLNLTYLEKLESYTVELRDKGFHGFLLPENQIIPNNEENIEGTKAVADYIKQTFLTLTETEWLANCKSTVASLSATDAFDGSCEALFKLNVFRKSFGAGFLE